jgi:hypothetical protein
MSWKNRPLVQKAALIAATLLFVAPHLLAGDKDHSPNPQIVHLQPAPAPVVRAMPPAAYSVVVRMSVQPPSKPFYVDLRGPDGQVRRFPVEGGRAAIRYRQVVLHPGERLTIHWVAAK